jgi:hypothetical protein
MVERNPNSGPDSGSLSVGVAAMAVYCLLNSLVISLIALLHPIGSMVIRGNSQWTAILFYLYALVVQAFLLTLPGWTIGSLLCRHSVRVGTIVGAVFILSTPLLFYLDVYSHLLTGHHLLTSEAFNVISLVAPSLADYTQETSYWELFCAGAIFVTIEFAAWKFSRRCVQCRASATHTRFFMGTAIVLTIPFFTLLNSSITSQISELPARHPLSVTTLFDSLSHIESQEVRGFHIAADLVLRQPVVDEFKKKYSALQIENTPESPPDILIVLVESLRHDALTSEVAPNLVSLGKRGSTGTSHFSAGNASQFGFFGAMYGLDPAFYPAATVDHSPALSHLLQEAGYFCAFLGHGPLELNYVEDFVNERAFDHFELDEQTPYHLSDQHSINRARAIFARGQQFASQRHKPVCIFLYLFTTHSEYHYEPEDEIYEVVSNSVSAIPVSTNQIQSLKNRYFNSVHCMDRLIAPLLKDKDRLIFVVGDHGESFGEDGRLFHGTAMSFSQLKTPLIVQAPGRAATVLTKPTTHMDLLPTILSEIDVRLNFPEVLTGRSIFDAQAESSFVVRENLSNDCILLEVDLLDQQSFVKFSLDLKQPFFSYRDVIDRQGRSISVDERRILLFETALDEWLTGMLGISDQPVSKDTLENLIQSLNRPERSIQLAAMEIMRQMGPSANAATPKLQQLLSDTDDEIRAKAVETLIAINGSSLNLVRDQLSLYMNGK